MNDEYFICKLVPRGNNKVSLVWFNDLISLILKTVEFDNMGELFDEYNKIRGV